MPIYEFQCLKCQHAFEDLVFGGALPACPHCGGKDTEKLISRPARARRGGDGMDAFDNAGSGGSSCASCGGGNCASCGH